MINKKQLSIKQIFWVVIIFVTILLSFGSWISIYNLRHVYSNFNVLKMSLDAVNYLRTNYGLAATDLAMQKVESRKNATIFGFDYEYNTPIMAVKNNSQAIVMVKFDKEKIIKVEVNKR